jgi:hypothetical protein
MQKGKSKRKSEWDAQNLDIVQKITKLARRKNPKNKPKGNQIMHLQG